MNLEFEQMNKYSTGSDLPIRETYRLGMDAIITILVPKREYLGLLFLWKINGCCMPKVAFCNKLRHNTHEPTPFSCSSQEIPNYSL